MKPHRRRHSPPRRQKEPVPPQQAEEPPVAQPVPVPPAAEQPVVVPPAHEPVPPAQEPVPPAPEPVPPAAEPEVVYDYTQGGEPQVYQQPGEPQPQPAAPQEPGYEQPQLPPAQPTYSAPAPAAQPSPKVPQRGPAPRRRMNSPATRGASTAGNRRPGQRTLPAPAAQGGGFSFMSVLMLMVALVLLVLCILVMIPSDLSHIDGYSTASSDSLEKPKDVTNLLHPTQQVMLNGGEVVFTEKQVNEYLSMRLKGEQGGALGGMMDFKGVCVDLKAGSVEIFIERSFAGIPVTTSSRFKLSKRSAQNVWESDGGKVGILDLGMKSQFSPILKSFRRLGDACAAEVQLLDTAAVVFSEDKITLKY